MLNKLPKAVTTWPPYIMFAMLVILAAYTLLGRGFMVLVLPEYKDDIAALLSETLSADIIIDDIEGGWRGFDPLVLLRGVTLNPRKAGSASSADALHVSAITLQPSVVKSIISGRLEMQKILVGQLDIRLEQSAEAGDSRQQLNALLASSLGKASKFQWSQLNNLLATPALEFEKLSLRWQKNGQDLLNLSVPSMMLQVEGSVFKFSGSIRQANDDMPLGQFTMHAQLSAQNQVSSEIYFDWRNSVLFRPLEEWLANQGLLVNFTSTSGALWLTATNGKLAEAALEIKPSKFVWQTRLACLAPVEDLHGKYLLTHQADGWTLRGADVSLSWAGHSPLPAQFIVDHLYSGDSGQNPLYLAQLKRINVGQLRRLLAVGDYLPQVIAQPLHNYRPDGYLDNVTLEVWPSLGRFNFAAKLESFAVRAHKGAPFINNLDGSLEFNENTGKLNFFSEQMTLGFPQLYYAPWQLDKASGRVSWKLESKRLTVAGTELSLKNPNGKQGDILGSFSLQTPTPDDVGHFDLTLDVKNAVAALVSDLVPGHQVGEATQVWLESAFRAGIVTQGQYQFSGEIGALASPAKRRSSLDLNFDDLELKFLADWPAVEGLSGNIALRGSTLEGDFGRADIGGTVISQGSMALSNLGSSAPKLNVWAQTQPTQRDWRYWLLQSPAARFTREAVADWQIAGSSTVDFSMYLNFADKAPIIRTDISADGMTLRSAELGLDISKVFGNISFATDKGFTGRELTGEVFKQQLRGKIDTPRWTNNEKSVALNLRSRVTARELANLLTTDVNLPIAGAFNYNLDLKLSTGARAELDYSLSSDLRGLEIYLPGPYRKKATDSLETRLNRVWSFDDQQGRWMLDVKGWLDVNLLDGSAGEENEIHTGLVRFGHKGKYKLPEQGIELVGSLPEVNVPLWQSFVGRYLPQQQSSQRIPDWLTGFELNVERLALGAESFDKVFLSAERKSPGNMTVFVKDESRVEGEILIPVDPSEKLQLEFARLHINPGSANVAKSELIPQELPLVDARVSDLRLGEKKLGSWSWVMQSRDNGVVFDDVEARFPGAVYSGRLSWLYDKEIDGHTTILTGGLRGGKFQDFSRLWTDRPPLNSESFSVSTGVVWDRAPMDFSLELLNGKFSFDLKNGTMNDTSASADIFRIFGILNTDALTRRLRLDFSDLYEEGLAYDQIEGRARIQKGRLQFESPLAIQAPSSAFKITGTTNLVDDSLDMNMVVILPLTKNLPLASLLVGVPQIGGAVFLIDRLLGEPLSSLTSATYRVTGTLQKPDIKLTRIFEDNSARNNSEDPVFGEN